MQHRGDSRSNFFRVSWRGIVRVLVVPPFYFTEPKLLSPARLSRTLYWVASFCLPSPCLQMRERERPYRTGKSSFPLPSLLLPHWKYSMSPYTSRIGKERTMEKLCCFQDSPLSLLFIPSKTPRRGGGGGMKLNSPRNQFQIRLQTNCLWRLLLNSRGGKGNFFRWRQIRVFLPPSLCWDFSLLGWGKRRRRRRKGEIEIFHSLSCLFSCQSRFLSLSTPLFWS